MAPALETALGLSHAEFGLLIAAYYAAMVALALPVGYLADRLGIVPMLVISHVVLALGMFVVARSQGFASCAFGLALCGSGYAFVNPATARAVLLWFPDRGRATAMGVKQTGVPVGGVAAAVVVAAGGDAWRELALAIAALTALTAAGFATLRAPAGSIGHVTRLKDLARLLARPRLAGINIASSCYACAYSGLFAYLVLFAHDVLALDAAAASLCLGIAHGAAAAGRIGLGITSDILRDGRRIGLLGAGTLGAAGLVALSAMVPDSAPWVVPLLAVFLGLTVGGNASLGQTAAVEAVERPLAGTAAGYSMLMVTAGSMVAPAGVGLAIEAMGYSAAWLVLAAILLVGALLFWVSISRR